MKAMLCTAYGPPEVMQLGEVPQPIPKDNEIMVMIKATTVTAGDCELRRMDLAWWVYLPMRLYVGLRKPRLNIFGQEFAGEVVEVGKAVTDFKVGDAIFAPTDMSFGTYLEYKCIKAKAPMARKPKNMNYEEAATIPTGGLNALHFIRKLQLKPGEKLLIIGAAGAIGTYAIQLAKLRGAEVTAIDSGRKLDMMRAMGADHVIDYTQEDYSQSGIQYDAIFDVINRSALGIHTQLLKTDGRYIMANPNFGMFFKKLTSFLFSKRKLMSGLAAYTSEDLQYLVDLIEAGKLRTYIDRSYPLEGIPEAHRYVDEGLKIGNLVIKL